jgi:phenol 2-monooxygenase
MLSIPRERNMTRLYIELHPGTTQPIAAEVANQDFVMRRAAEILHPFHIKWKSIGRHSLLLIVPYHTRYVATRVPHSQEYQSLTAAEWFSVYRVGQRIASCFALPSQGIFLVGDAAHTHSPKAAQGMNVSMHDSFNLAWKLNLVLRNIAPPSLLDTYEIERKQIANQLIEFDFGHANAFLAGDAQALAKNFDDNIRFISGVGAEYKANTLNKGGYDGGYCFKGALRTGALLPPAKVTRYIDANPVDIQLDIPLLSQFRLYFFVPDINLSMAFLNEVCDFLTHDGSALWRASQLAERSYELLTIKETEADEYLQPKRYNGFSRLFTPAIVTTMKKENIEIKDLPVMFRSSPWTFYLDDIGSNVGSCTEKWFGRLDSDVFTIINVRPDGYVGSVGRFKAGDEGMAKKFLDEYYAGFLNG